MLTAVTVAENDAVEAPDATVTADGTVTALLLLARLTLTPPDGAGAVRDTVHEVVPAPVNELELQDSVLMPEVAVAGAGAISEIEADNAVLPCVAVIFAVWLVLTAAAFAANIALVAPAATVTDDGTVSAEVLLERFTARPPVGAKMLDITVHVSVPDPEICALAQLNPLSAAVWPDFDPLPWSLTVRDGVEELLVMTLKEAVESTASVGLKCTLRFRLLPPARFTGRVPWPSTVKDVSDVASCVIATDADPAFVIARL